MKNAVRGSLESRRKFPAYGPRTYRAPVFLINKEHGLRIFIPSDGPVSTRPNTSVNSLVEAVQVGDVVREIHWTSLSERYKGLIDDCLLCRSLAFFIFHPLSFASKLKCWSCCLSLSFNACFFASAILWASVKARALSWSMSKYMVKTLAMSSLSNRSRLLFSLA